MSPAQVFLLSPAFCGGRRAGILLAPKSEIALATRLAQGTLTLGEAFAFMSGLYFRGKLAYANHFGRAGRVGQVGEVAEAEASLSSATRLTSPTRPVLVITPTRGLQPPESLVTSQLLREFAKVDVDSSDRRYRGPLDRDLHTLVASISSDTRVILLGSIATGKYLDALTDALGPRLYYPSTFVGRGDMSRGGLMLRSVAADVELEYVPFSANAPRHGVRPPKLDPLGRVGVAGRVGLVKSSFDR